MPPTSVAGREVARAHRSGRPRRQIRIRQQGHRGRRLWLPAEAVLPRHAGHLRPQAALSRRAERADGICGGPRRRRRARSGVDAPRRRLRRRGAGALLAGRLPAGMRVGRPCPPCGPARGVHRPHGVEDAGALRCACRLRCPGRTRGRDRTPDARRDAGGPGGEPGAARSRCASPSPLGPPAGAADAAAGALRGAARRRRIPGPGQPRVSRVLYLLSAPDSGRLPRALGGEHRRGAAIPVRPLPEAVRHLPRSAVHRAAGPHARDGRRDRGARAESAVRVRDAPRPARSAPARSVVRRGPARHQLRGRVALTGHAAQGRAPSHSGVAPAGDCRALPRARHRHRGVLRAGVPGGRLGFDRCHDRLRDRSRPHRRPVQAADPYPGTPLWKQLASRVYERDWERFDGFTPTFHHPTLGADELRYLLGAAYVRFYMRPSYLANYCRIRGAGAHEVVSRLDARVRSMHARREFAEMARRVSC